MAVEIDSNFDKLGMANIILNRLYEAAFTAFGGIIPYITLTDNGINIQDTEICGLGDREYCKYILDNFI